MHETETSLDRVARLIEWHTPERQPSVLPEADGPQPDDSADPTLTEADADGLVIEFQ